MSIRFKKEDIVLITVTILVILLAIIVFSCSILAAKHKKNQIVTHIEKQTNNDTTKTKRENSKTTQGTTTTEWKCLDDDVIVEYEVVKTGIKNGYISVTIKDKIKETQRLITISDIRTNYRPVELHGCGIYYVRLFNYDSKNAKKNKGYRSELTVNDYSENKKELLVLSEMKEDYYSYYSPDFRVSTNEKYVVLEKGTLYDPDYSLIIKTLDTLEDVFVLTMPKVSQRYYGNDGPLGNFGMWEWRDNDRYFWADIFAAAATMGYLRIDTTDWGWEFYEAPPGALGGFEPNLTSGWMPYVPSAVWTGIQEMDDEIRKEAKKESKTSILYIYNFFTKEKIKIDETADDPIWNFGSPIWKSGTELEYKLPGGKKKIYKLKRL